MLYKKPLFTIGFSLFLVLVVIILATLLSDQIRHDCIHVKNILILHAETVYYFF